MKPTAYKHMSGPHDHDIAVRHRKRFLWTFMSDLALAEHVGVSHDRRESQKIERDSEPVVQLSVV